MKCHILEDCENLHHCACFTSVSKVIPRMVLYLWFGCLDKMTCHVLERILDDCVQSDFGYIVWLCGQSDSIMETLKLCI